MSRNAVDEKARQRALDLYRVVETLPQAAYEDIVRLAATVCGVAESLHADEAHERVFLRADAALSQERTAAR